MLFEPYRSRMVEPIPLTTRPQREQFIAEAGYNPFLLQSHQVLIDLVTDSGTSALSTRQWSGMLGADESFTGSRSFFRFREAVQSLFGHRFVIPCHQGRAAEHLLARAVLRSGDVVFANTLFATTRENFSEAGAEGHDLPLAASAEPSNPHPFKGNVDLAALEAGIGEVGPDRVRLVVVTVTENSRGGQPVSLANLRAVAALCRRHRIPLFLDAARFAENAALIRQREPGCAHMSPREIAREMFACTDGVFLSMKKDGLGNSGGLISLNDPAWAEAVQVRLLVTEGIPSAGGLAARDLEAMTVALEEMLAEDYLTFRLASTARLGEALAAAGVPVVQPIGAHAVYIDGRAFCPHLPDEHLPAWSLSVALYLHAGIRGWETGNVMQGRPEANGEGWRWPALDLFRLAIPRRVYSLSHLDYTAAAMVELYHRRETVRGLRFLYRPPALAQFVATFEPV